jgi:TnpA family transposase
VPPALRPLIGGRINIRPARENWPDVLGLAASMAAGTIVPSQILRKRASNPFRDVLFLMERFAQLFNSRIA